MALNLIRPNQSAKSLQQAVTSTGESLMKSSNCVRCVKNDRHKKKAALETTSIMDWHNGNCDRASVIILLLQQSEPNPVPIIAVLLKKVKGFAETLIFLQT